MRCPACQTEAPADATTCPACRTALVAPPLQVGASVAVTPARPRKPRRRGIGEESETPFSANVAGPNRRALRAYQLSVYGLFPGAGLVLGPLAVVLALDAQRRGRGDPEFTAHVPAKGAILLGTLLTLTNWAGLALMVLGLRSS